MNALFPILAAVLQAGSFTLDKFTLSLKRVSPSAYLGVSFPLIFAITLLIFAFVRPPLSFALLGGRLGWLLAASVALAVITNFLYYRALDHDGLAELETVGLVGRVPTILAAGLIFSDERNPAFLVPALVAAAAVVWAHWERRHFQMAANTRPLLIWAFIVGPAGAAISKELLSVWHPVSLELVRSGAMALMLGPLYAGAVRQLSQRALGFLVVTNILTTVAWILYYTSFQRSGIVYTMLLFSLQPLLVYLAALFFLKEAFHWKKFAAFLMVLGSIGVAQAMR